MQSWQKEKYKQIDKALKQTNEHSHLRNLCRTPGGLLDVRTRSIVWPKLMPANSDTLVHTPPFDTINHLAVIGQSDFDRIFNEYSTHRDYKIVKMDVKRCGSRLPKRMAESDTLKWQGHTIQLIMNVLHLCPALHYYQGYHDVALTILFCFGYNPIATTFLWYLSHHFLVDFMYKDMSKTSSILKFLRVIVSQVDPILSHFLTQSGAGEIFCLSWLITWFSHSLSEIGMLMRLFDLFLVSHPFMPIYVTAAIVLQRRDELLVVECEMAHVHQFLSSMATDVSFENVVQHALDLMTAHPPGRLSRVNRIPLRNLHSNTRYIQIFDSRRISPRILKILRFSRFDIFRKTEDTLIFPLTLTISIALIGCLVSATVFVLSYFEIVLI